MIAYVRVVVLRFMRYVSEVHLNADQRRPQKLKLREQQYLLLVENKPVRSWSSRANWFRLSKERSSTGQANLPCHLHTGFFRRRFRSFVFR